MRRLLKPALLRSVLAAPLIFMMVCLIWLFSTKEGTVLVASLANELLPELQIDNIDGYLLGTLHAEQVEWRDEWGEVSVAELSFDWNPLCFLNIELCIGQLQAKKLNVVVLPQDDKNNASSGLPEIIMPLGINVSSANIANFGLKISENEHIISDIALSGSWIGSLLVLESIEAEYQQLKCITEGELDFSLPWKTRFNGDLSYEIPSDKGSVPLQLAFNLKGEQLSFDISGDLLTKELENNIPAKLSASVSFDEPDLPLRVVLESPVSLVGAINVNALTVDASLKNLTATINSKTKTPYWSELDLSIDTQWVNDEVLLKRADIKTESGELSLQGKLSNSPELPFELSVSSTQLALHALTLPENTLNKAVIPYPIFIDSLIKFKGQFGGEQPQVDINVSTLEGTLNHKPVSAEGHFNITSTLLNIDHLIIKSGKNQISGRGTSNTKSHTVNLKVFLPEPELWVPGLTGRVEGRLEGHVDGRIDANDQLGDVLNNADLRGELSISDLTFKEYAIQSALFNFDIKKLAQQSSLLKLNMQNLTLGGVTLEAAQWQLKGDKAHADLTGELKVKNYGAAGLRCDVSYITSPREMVEGVCDEFSWLANIYPNASFGWKNKDTLSINWDVASSALELAPFCVTSQEGTLCNSEPATWSPEKGYSVSLNADDIALRRQNHRWPELFKLDGILSASAKVSQKPGETIDADVEITLPKGDFSWVKNTNDSPILISVDDLSLTASMHSDELTLNTRFTSPQLGDIQSQLAIADIGDKRALSGDIKIGQLNLSSFDDVIPSVETLQGMISSQLTLSGHLAKPIIEGEFKLSEGELKSDYLPETLREINIAANFDQQILNYKGHFESDGGHAILDGELDWEKQWVLKTSLESKAFQITPRSGISLTIKPTVSLLLKDGEVDVSGTLEIPHARIELKGLPAEAKSVSSDVRIVGQETEELAGTDWTYNTNIDIILGKDVHFRGFGVNTYLKGNLLLNQKENGVFTGAGQVITEDGFYTIWGQRLTVKEGRFNFSGPLEEPDLQLDATRTISDDNVTVGVRVTGSASDPEVNFYSQPAMNESTVLHYLLTGQSPDQETNNSSLLNNMVLSAGVFGSSEITEKLASKVGVSDFKIATSADEDGTSVELSGYISPDIYLKYGVSLYDEANTVAMRYRLKQNLFLEAASGISSSLDIVYSFERR